GERWRIGVGAHYGRPAAAGADHGVEALAAEFGAQLLQSGCVCAVTASHAGDVRFAHPVAGVARRVASYRVTGSTYARANHVPIKALCTWPPIIFPPVCSSPSIANIACT